MSSEALAQHVAAINRVLNAGESEVDSDAMRQADVAVDALLAEVARLEQAVGDVTRERAVAGLRLHRAEAALAVAREREQRLREAAAEALAFIDALALAVSGVDSREWNPLPVQFRDAVTTLRRGADDALRAALVDEPAAAMLSEPGSSEGREDFREVAPGAIRKDATVPGSLSTAPATLAEPGRENVYPGLANQSPEQPGSASAAADEPGETPG